MQSLTALNSFLQPFEEYFNRDGVTDMKHLRGMASLIAQSTEQMIDEEHPLLSGTLPNGYRVQIVIPPACEAGQIAYSIRKPSPLKWTLDDYEKMNCFNNFSITSVYS